MSLVKKMRKSKTKIMVGLLIFIMVGFVLGASLPALFEQISIWREGAKPLAVYGDDLKITRLNRQKAIDELQILQELMADRFLMFATSPGGGINHQARLLGQVLFPESGAASFVSDELKQAAMQGQLYASKAEIDEFFRQIKGSGDAYWILLNAEAKKAGIVIPNAQAKEILKTNIPALTQGQASAALLVNNISNKHRLHENKIIDIFADLLGILTYANTVTSSEDVTINQLRSIIGQGNQKISAEFVKFEIDNTSAKVPEPTEEQIKEQFEKYKTFESGVITEENQYGFGYVQPAAAVLDYFIVKTQDVRETITRPSEQEVEDYYAMNPEEFTSEEPVDPDDPEGETIKVTKEYIEVANQIRGKLMNQKTSVKTDVIMSDALSMMEQGLSGIDLENITAEDYKENAADFAEVAQKITDKYGVKVYTGQTGRLSQSNLASDMNLGMLVKDSRTAQDISLPKIVFSVDELGLTKMGKFEMPTPKMWEPIGPLSHSFRIMSGLVRVVDAKKSFVPESINLEYSTKGAPLDQPFEITETEYILKKDIAEDVKTKNALQIAKKKAEEFARMLDSKTWQEAVEEFNKANTDSPVRRVRLADQKDRSRSSALDKKILEKMAEGNLNPSIQFQLKRNKINSMLQEKLHDLIPEGTNEITDAKTLFEFKPEAAYYLVKSISLTEPTDADYKESKVRMAYMLNNANNGSLALKHFSPDNIAERMNFEWRDQEDDEDSEQAENSGDGE